MFLPGDFTSEVIAHFIGYFQVQTEDARLRFEYASFDNRHHTSPETPLSPVTDDGHVRSGDVPPHPVQVHYVPPSFAVEHLAHVSSVHVDAPQIPHGPIAVHVPLAHLPIMPAAAAGQGAQAQPAAEPSEPVVAPAPGSVVLVVEQDHLLSDDDMVVLGAPDEVHAAELPVTVPITPEALVAAAATVNEAYAPPATAGSVEQVGDFVRQVAAAPHAADALGVALQTAEAIQTAAPGAAQSVASIVSSHVGTITTAPAVQDGEAFPAAPAHIGDGGAATAFAAAPEKAADGVIPADETQIARTVVLEGPEDPASAQQPAIHQIAITDTIAAAAIDGSYLNGGETSHVPNLTDSLPAGLRAEVVSPAPPPDDTASAASLSEHPADAAVSMEAATGGNLLANAASLTNGALTSTFLGVAGDYHRLDAVIQTNAFSDDDSVDPLLVGPQDAVADVTRTVNVASFQHETRDTAGDMAEHNTGIYPSNWIVSSVAGDVVFMNWISQYGFTSDNDTQILKAAGTHTTITSGENFGLNHVSFADLGSYYDIVLVDGHLYDANIIDQTNVLVDNDLVMTLPGMSGVNGSASTSGNLLWNEANIVNVGASDWQQGLPASYQNIMGAVSGEDYHALTTMQTNQSFEGFATMRVLDIAGSLYDLNYIRQVNVLGDSDRVALYHDKLLAAQPETVWDMSTGGNALVNVASIIDYDSVGSTAFYGGTMYSDAVLVQADIIQSTKDVLTPHHDALANEVLAFLDDDSVDASASAPSHDLAPVSVHADAPTLDAMHSMFA